MKRVTDFLEKFLLPVASKFATQRHLMSIKDAFIAMLPVTLVGSMAVLLNVFVRDLPVALWGDSNVITSHMQWLIEINGMVWWGSLAIMALLFTFSLGYNLAKNANVDPLPGGIVALSVLVATIPQTMAVEGLKDPVWGVLQYNYISATGLFTAMIMVLLALELYVLVIKKNFTIKMPEQVPANVSSAFTAFIPAMVAIFFSAIVTYAVVHISGMPVNDLVGEYVMKPLLGLSQGYFAVMVVTFFTQVLWFFGIHGMNVLAAIYESVWGVAQIQNIDAHTLGKAIPYMWTRASFDLYGTFGGSGATLGLIVAMFIFGKNADTKALRKIAAAPSVFNINEPLIFGIPIILNPIYIIPWVLVPMITMSIGYFMTSIGFAGPVVVGIPWVTPVIFSSFLATAGSIGAVITQVICLAVTILIWSVFLIIAERLADKAYKAE